MSDVLLECFPWISIHQQDASAMGEAMFIKYVVHYDIVLVGVYAQRRRMHECPFEKFFCCMVARLMDGDAMYHMIW
jgi:hypothetical protein